MRACETVTNPRRWRGSAVVARRGSGAVVAALAATVALGGCAAGQHAETQGQYSTIDGASADLGAIGVRNAGVAAPKDNSGYQVGADAQLVMAMVNNSTTADQLVSVTSTAAAKVVISKGTSSDTSPGPVTGSGGGSPSAGALSSSSSSSNQSTPSTPATTAPSSSSTTPTPEGGSASPTASGPVTIPANGLVQVGPGTPADTVITMTGLKQALTPGLSVPVTFAFASAGRITLQLPVRLIPDNTGGATISVGPTGD
ncbi:MAG: hypothetical protein ABJA87_12830 [bacterium]